jgi:hypothetical protein
VETSQPKDPEDGASMFSETVLQGTKSQKTSVIDITMKAPQKTVFFEL